MTLGTAVGVLPGIGPALTVAVLLPVTFTLDPISAFIMFGGIYYGAMYGGSTTSILLNSPGETGSIATAIDGHMMARQGRGAAALTTAAIGSFVAGTLATVALTFFAPPLASVALRFGPAEYFALTILAFTTVAALLGSSVMRGLLSLFLGLALGLIGIDQLTGNARFSFGIPQLLDGIDVMILVIGLFAVGETLYQAWRHGRDEEHIITLHDFTGMSREDWRRSWKPWLRGTAIGFPLGVLPCGGSVIPTFVSYMVEKRLSDHPEEFGHGAIEGVAGPEAANNAAAAGVLVPLLTLGLPSSATAAVLLTAFQQYGLQPGPLLFTARPDLVWTLIASLYIGNVMLLVLNLPLAGVWARVMLVPRPLLFGGILVLASLGAYSLNRSMLDLVLLYVGRRGRLRDAHLRRAARAGGARPHPRSAVGAAVPPRAGHQRRGSLGVRHAADLRDAAAPRERRARRPVRPAPLAPCHGRHHEGPGLRRRRARRRQCGPVRRAHGAGSGRERDRPGIGAAAFPRRQQPAHAQPPVGARRAHRRADRRLPGGRVPGRSASRHRQRHRRGAGAAGGQPIGGVPRLDAAPRRPVPVVAARHAAPRSHQRVLSRRRQGADEQLLRRRRAPGHRRGLRRRGRRPRPGGWPLRGRDACASAAATRDVRARAAVLAAGGFESNLEWLREAWGDAADNFIIRGTPYNKGTLLRLMLDAGAQSVGDPRACHAIAVDARAPKFDGGIVTRLDCVPLGIVVNNRCERFYDEGEDFWPKRYAIWGSLIARQPDQIAFSIVDAKAIGRFMPSVFPPIVAPTRSRELAASARPASRTASRRPSPPSTRRSAPARSTTQVLDDCRTEGLDPPKSHWAQRIDTPPFWGYPLRPGITFTYLGLKVDERARVLMADGEPADNIYAAGEIMAGNILRKGYIAGVGMTIGTVFGRIAGEEAARHADLALS